MRILLDENLPRKLKWRFCDTHEVKTVSDLGWQGLKNGALLRQAELQFDVLVTVDKGMRYQQTLVDFDLAVIVLQVASNTYPSLLPFVPRIEEALETVASRTISHIA